MKYDVIVSPKAQNHITHFRQTGQKSIINKIDKLIEELENHPRTGTGKPELLKHLNV